MRTTIEAQKFGTESCQQIIRTLDSIIPDRVEYHRHTALAIYLQNAHYIIRSIVLYCYEIWYVHVEYQRAFQVYERNALYSTYDGVLVEDGLHL